LPEEEKIQQRRVRQKKCRNRDCAEKFCRLAWRNWAVEHGIDGDLDQKPQINRCSTEDDSDMTKIERIRQTCIKLVLSSEKLFQPKDTYQG
jgi:hypothetical protein